MARSQQQLTASLGLTGSLNNRRAQKQKAGFKIQKKNPHSFIIRYTRSDFLSCFSPKTEAFEARAKHFQFRLLSIIATWWDANDFIQEGGKWGSKGIGKADDSDALMIKEGGDDEDRELLKSQSWTHFTFLL